MASSRRSTPAIPTSSGAPAIASRGGLFTTPNASNVDSGTRIPGTGTGGPPPSDATISVRINDDTQTFTLNQAADGSLNFDVDASAILRYAQGQANTIGTSTLTFDSLVVDDTTGLELIADGDGVRLTSMDTPVPSRGFIQTRAVNTNALVAPIAPTATVTTTGGVITAAMTTVTGTNPAGQPLPTSITETATIPSGGTTTVTLTIPDSDIANPMADYTAPGTYTVTTTATTDNDDTSPTTTRDTETFTRFIPFFQSRAEPMTSADLTGGTFTSTAGWSNSLTATAGTGVLYFSTTDLAATTGVVTARTSSGFPVRYASLRTIDVEDANGDTLTYTVFRAPADAGVTLTFS